MKIYLKISAVLILISLVLPIYVPQAKAEACWIRALLGYNDIFWGDPPPLNPNQSPPRAYPDVSARPGDTVKLSVEGEFPGDTIDGPDCLGQMAYIEIYNDGGSTPVRTISGSLQYGFNQVVSSNLGSYQWVVYWPHDLFDGRYRFKVTKIGTRTIDSFLSSNLLIVSGAGQAPPPPPPTCSVTGVSWNSNRYVVGDTATMSITVNDANACLNNYIYTYIYEYDSLNPDDLLLGPLSTLFNSSTNTVTLTHTFTSQDYINGGSEPTNEDVYFISQSQTQSTYAKSTQVPFYLSNPSPPPPPPPPPYSQGSYVPPPQPPPPAYSQGSYVSPPPAYSQGAYYDQGAYSPPPPQPPPPPPYSQTSYVPPPGPAGGPPPPTGQSFDLSIPNPFGSQIDTFDQLFGAILKFLYYLAAPIVVIMIIMAGLYLLFGRGEPDKIKIAKQILTFAIIGLVIILIGSGFVTLLKSIFALGG